MRFALPSANQNSGFTNGLSDIAKMILCGLKIVLANQDQRRIAYRHEIEEVVKLVRLNLYSRDLFCGAQAILWELEDLGVSPLPSLRTINRILKRNDLTHRRTGKYEPKGTPYPKLPALLPNQTHQMDMVWPLLFDRSDPFLRAKRDRYGNGPLWAALLVIQVSTRCSGRNLGHRVSARHTGQPPS